MLLKLTYIFKWDISAIYREIAIYRQLNNCNKSSAIVFTELNEIYS